MSDAILVANAGSSSIKFSIFLDRGADLELDVRGQVEKLTTAPRLIARDREGKVLRDRSWPGAGGHGKAEAMGELRALLAEELAGDRLVGVAHRVVHGGYWYHGPVIVDDEVLEKLARLNPFAPLHQPHNLQLIRAVAERLPDVPQVACFDTAFHCTAPDLAQRFALPADMHDMGVRRYGFHGLSYEYIASVLPGYDAHAAAGRTVVMHLGSGSSMCAMRGCRSVATTTGLTALDGLPMGTRVGAIDPGVPLLLIRLTGMTVDDVEELFYNKSGLLGVSGISNDMRTLLASEEPRARLAVDLYLYRMRRELGSMAGALEGLDAVVFTGGIGENSAEVRARACRDAAWLGVELDPAANAAGGPRISAPGSRVSAWAIPTNEELMIARHAKSLLSAA